MLGSVSGEDTTIIADLEAGIGTLSRLSQAAIDVTLVVVEPTPRSINVALRAVGVATEQNQGRVVVVANKIEDADDRDRISKAFPGLTVVEVPTDPVIDEADRLGVSPLDHGPLSPAIKAFERLTNEIVP